MKSKGWWLLPALAGFLLNLLTLTSFFNSDDFGLLRAVRDHGPFGIWSGHGQPFFRPLVSASIWLDSRMFGLDPAGYHLVNTLLHAANAGLVAVVVYRLAQLVRASTEVNVALIAGLLFAALPCHAEAAAWVSGRTDLLSTFFALSSAAVFLSGARYRLVISGVMFFAALLSKESPLLLPLFFFVVMLGVSEAAALRRQALLGLAIVPIYLLLRFAVLGQMFGGYGSGSYFGVGLAGLLKNAVVYLTKTVEPGSTQMLASQGVPGLDERTAILFAIPAILIAGWGAFRLTKSGDTGPARLAWIGFVGFFVLALPALPLGMNAFTAEGSRFIYLPSIGICLSFAAALTSIRLAPARWALAGCLSALYAVSLWAANAVWHEAGEDARKSLSALRDLPANGRLLSVPDSYRGAYVLRNCLDDGVSLFVGIRAPIPVLSTYSYDSPGFAPTLRAGNGMQEVSVGGTLGCLLTPGAAAEMGQSGSPVVKYSPRVISLKGSDGFVLTPSGLLTP